MTSNRLQPDRKSPRLSSSSSGGTRSRRRLLLIPLGALCLALIAAVVASVVGFALPFFGGDDSPKAEDASAVGADANSVVTALPPSQFGLPQKNPTDPRRAFLLLGYGGGGHEGAYLTDSLMLVIEDPSQKTLAMLSLPRDSWAPLMFDGKAAVFNKLNTAYAFAKDTTLYRNRLPRYTGANAAGRFSLDTVSRLTGVPIANYAAIDFDGFRQMIDAVGGIDVEVPASFSARYPANDNPAIDPSWITVSFTKGTEHMNGERAIRFARAREALTNPSEGSDFARSRRQRLIMEGFKNRVLTPGGLLQLPQVLGIAAKHVDTDYAVPDAAQLGQLALGFKDYHIFQTALTTSNYLDDAIGPGGAYILAPATADRSWSQVRAFVRHLWQDPAAGVAMAATRVKVVNDAGVSGLAGRLSDALVKLGYRVATPETGQVTAKSQIVDRTGGKALALIQQLQLDLNLQAEVVVGEASPEGDEIELHLGGDDIGVADLKVAEDTAAPVSAIGVVTPGEQAPDPAPATKPAVSTPVPAPSATAAGSRTPLATATPGAITATPTPVTSPSVTPTRQATQAAGTGTATPTPATTATTRTPTPTIAGATGTPTPTPARTVVPTATVPPTASPVRTPTAPAGPAGPTPTPTPLGTPMHP